MRDIHLEGSVGLAFWPDEPHFTAATVRAELAGAGDVTVHVNSGGGIATEGLAIYHLLKDHPGQVHVVVTGVAGSAASLIVMAGDRITMRTGAMLMIHDPAIGFTEGRGTEDDHRDIADMLAKMSEGYASIYAARAGITPDEAREIMRAETWLTAAEAVAAGFADDTDDAEVAAIAAFPWRVYANAPRHLLAGCRADTPARRAVLAMISGAAAHHPKEVTMKKHDETDMSEEDQIAPEAETEEDEVAAAETDEDEAAAPATEGEDDDNQLDEDDDETVAIIDIVAMQGGTIAEARDFIARGVKLSGVIAHYRNKRPSVTKHQPRGPQARILRDERDTRRAGMTEALAAQIGRRAPKDARARPFMAMSLAEMAAASMGVTRPLRTAHDRLQVFMDMHTTSDFPLSLSNALNKELESRYAEAQPTYRSIARQKTFRDFRPHPVIRPGDFPMLKPVGEGGEIKFGTIGEKAETVALLPYAVAVSISRQTLINDDIGAIADMVADQGRAISRFEEQTFYAMMLSGANSNGPTLTETGRQVFNATDTTLAGTPAAITVPSLSVGRAAIMKRTSVDGNKLGLRAAILLVGPDKLTEAQQIVTPIQPDSAGNVNPFSGQLQIVATPEIGGNAWYLFADPADGACFVYGYLEGAAAPRTRIEEPFGRQGTMISIEHDFGVGATDFRPGYRNAGA